MIYLNHSGTSWPKPESVHQAITNFSHLAPHQWNEIYESGLSTVTDFFNIPNPDRFVFTTSCTEALAIAFSDFPWNQGDRLIMSHMEHHALSRWYHKLQMERGIEGVVIPRSETGPFDLNVLEEELKKGASLVAVSMVSNVTGEVLPCLEILELCKKHGSKCLLDGAQAAGVIPINIGVLKPDFFVFAGHKGPHGPQGIGGLYIDENTSMICPSAACEIVPGSNRPSAFPTYCDTGSVNMQTLAGLQEGMKWVQEKNIETTLSHRRSLISNLQSAIAGLENISFLGTPMTENRIGTLAITSSQLSIEHLANQLWELGQIKAGTGFQCAPMAHEALGTAEIGCIRISVGPQSTKSEIDQLVSVLTVINSFSNL